MLKTFTLIGFLLGAFHTYCQNGIENEERWETIEFLELSEELFVSLESNGYEAKGEGALEVDYEIKEITDLLPALKFEIYLYFEDWYWGEYIVLVDINKLFLEEKLYFVALVKLQEE